MFDFLLDILKNQKKYLIKTYLSDNFSDFLKNNNISIKDIEMDICYIDISDKDGYIKILPSSKYLNILSKYKTNNGLSDVWFDKMKDDFPTYYKIYENKDINKNINNMRIGKWIRKYFKKEPYEIEILVDNYKKFQKD